MTNANSVWKAAIAVVAVVAVTTACRPVPDTPDVPAAPPSRICIFPDQTGSVIENLVPPVTLEDLGPLIGLLRKNGGQIRLGVIRAESDHPMVALRIEIPPPEPQPLEPTGNSLIDARRRRGWKKTHDQWQEEYSRWGDQTEDRIEDFMEAVGPLLAVSPGGATAFWEGVKRCNAFLSEPSPWPTAKQFALYVSDALDTVEGQPTSPVRNATTLLVNSAVVGGGLEGYSPIRFEGLSAAIDYIVKEASKP